MLLKLQPAMHQQRQKIKKYPNKMNNTTIINRKNVLPVLKIVAITDAQIIAGIHKNNLLAWEH